MKGKDIALLALAGGGALIAVSALSGPKEDQKANAGSGISISLSNPLQSLGMGDPLGQGFDLSGLTNSITSTLKSTGSMITSPADYISGAVSSVAEKTYGSVSSLTSSFTDNINNKLQDVFKTAGSGIKGVVDKTFETPMNLYSTVRSDASSVANTVSNVVSQVPDVAARAVPLGTIGFAAGGPIGAAAGGAAGNILYGFGQSIGNASMNFGNSLIRATGGLNSPIFQAGQFFNNIFTPSRRI